MNADPIGKRADSFFRMVLGTVGDGVTVVDADHFLLYLVDASGCGWAAALRCVSVVNVLRAHSLPRADFRRPGEVSFALNNTFPFLEAALH